MRRGGDVESTCEMTDDGCQNGEAGADDTNVAFECRPDHAIYITPGRVCQVDVRVGLYTDDAAHDCAMIRYRRRQSLGSAVGFAETSMTEAFDSQNTNEKYGVETEPTRHRKMEAPDKRDWKYEDGKVDDNVWYISPYEPSAIIQTMSSG